jgi:Flp pilus assembly pilin Flp
MTPMWFELPRLIRELAADDQGQDLIEYALVTAAIGLVGTATWPLIVDAIGNTYQGVDTATQNLWEVPDPQ